MKKVLFSLCMGLAALGYSSFAQAGPCEAAFCLWGATKGDVKVSGCTADVAQYFSIRRWNKYGFDAPRTEMARRMYLNTCTNKTPQEIQAVQYRFGYLYDDRSVY